MDIDAHLFPYSVDKFFPVVCLTNRTGGYCPNTGSMGVGDVLHSTKCRHSTIHCFRCQVIKPLHTCPKTNNLFLCGEDVKAQVIHIGKNHVHAVGTNIDGGHNSLLDR